MNTQAKPKRKSNRLKGYDYSDPGYYFVTLCAKNRKYFFGEISEKRMQLNDAGKMVKRVWDEVPVFYPDISVDEFVIMPNHIHGIIIINSQDNVGAGPCACPKDLETTYGQPRGVAPTIIKLSLPDIVHRFKSMTTRQYINGVKQKNWMPFDGKLWQRNYYEHVIRNNVDLDECRGYILNNQKKWHLDKYNTDF